MSVARGFALGDIGDMDGNFLWAQKALAALKARIAVAIAAEAVLLEQAAEKLRKA